MPNAYLSGIQSHASGRPEIRNDIYAVTSNWFVNRCPLVTRVPRIPVGSTTFSIIGRTYRDPDLARTIASDPGDPNGVLAHAWRVMRVCGQLCQSGLDGNE